MMDDEAQALEAQAEATLDVIRAAAVGLLLDGRVSPQLVALATARIAGELGASIAVADGLTPERVLGELADFTREAGRIHHGLVKLEGALPDPAPPPGVVPFTVARRG